MATREEMCNILSNQLGSITSLKCGSVVHWVLHQYLETQVKLCSWHSRKWVGRDGKVSFRGIMRQACIFHFPTKAGIFQDGVAEVQALTATVPGAPKDLKTSYFILLALSCL